MGGAVSTDAGESGGGVFYAITRVGASRSSRRALRDGGLDRICNAADDGRATVAEEALRPADDEQQRPVGTWTTTHAAEEDGEEEEEEEDEEREWHSVAEAADARLDRDEGCCWADKSLSLAGCLMAHWDRGGIAGGLCGRHQRESFPLTDSEDSALRDGY